MFDKLIDLLIEILRTFRCCVIVDAYQRGLVLRFGKYQREIGPGFHWIYPFYVERPLRANVVPETMLVGPQSLTTKDGVSVVISTVVTFSIEEVRKFLLEIEGAHQVIEDSAFGAVARFIMNHNWDEIRGVFPPEENGKPIDADNEIAKAVRRQAKKYGVAVLNVQICDFTRSRSYRLLQMSHRNTHGS